jgi:glutamyl-Q tRNA(Asp) synthetase
LHFGSLVAATASYLDARAHGGKWLVRMEDVDVPRVQPGAALHILQTLEKFGFEWDGEVVYQSARTAAYREVSAMLCAAGHVYPCGCNRKDTGERYRGTCRAGLSGKSPRSWRVRTSHEPITFIDRMQGLQMQNVEDYCGDFVILRADGLFAYQLAVVVDDREQGVTDIVRGADLLDSTARQIHLQRLLGWPTPRYMHTPVALNAAGQKLSKQTRAPAVNPAQAEETLGKVLAFLGQEPTFGSSLADIWRRAIENWRPHPTVSISPDR